MIGAQKLTVNLKLLRFLFTDESSVPGSLPTGALFYLTWSRANRGPIIGKSRLVGMTKHTASTLGTTIDFVSQGSKFMIDSSAMKRQLDRVIIISLMARDSVSPFATDAETAHDTLICSGTIDLSMFFAETFSKTYALSMESNFTVVGKLHFGLFVTETPSVQNNTTNNKVFQEKSVVIFVDEVVDEAICSGQAAPTDTPASETRIDRKSSPRSVLYDDKNFHLKVLMDGNEPVRLPVLRTGNGRLLFHTAVPLLPVHRIKFILCEEATNISSASVRTEKLTAFGLPKDFSMPLKGDGGSHLQLHFTVREEVIMRQGQGPDAVLEASESNEGSAEVSQNDYKNTGVTHDRAEPPNGVYESTPGSDSQITVLPSRVPPAVAVSAPMVTPTAGVSTTMVSPSAALSAPITPVSNESHQSQSKAPFFFTGTGCERTTNMSDCGQKSNSIHTSDASGIISDLQRRVIVLEEMLLEAYDTIFLHEQTISQLRSSQKKTIVHDVQQSQHILPRHGR